MKCWVIKIFAQFFKIIDPIKESVRPKISKIILVINSTFAYSDDDMVVRLESSKFNKIFPSVLSINQQKIMPKRVYLSICTLIFTPKEVFYEEN